MAEAPLWVWPALLGVLGAVFGSFIATVAIRWPQGRGVGRGRSLCDACATPLGPAELVPLFSYLRQQGACRHCGARIAPSHFWTEVIGLAIGVMAGIAAPGAAGAWGALFGWLLLALGALDLAAFWLPNLLTATLAASGLAAGLLTPYPPALVDRLIGGAAGFGGLWLVAALYRAVRHRHGLGGGDGKMLGGIGLWLGWRALPLTLLVACLIGLGVVLLLQLRGRRMTATDRLPLGVMLAVAAFAVWLWSTPAPGVQEIETVTVPLVAIPSDGLAR